MAKKVALHEEYLNATAYGTFDENKDYLQPGITINGWLQGLAMQAIMRSSQPMLSPEETAILAKEYAAAMTVESI